jgi:hypothetical protein
LDANHATPGAGYLHMVMWLYTDPRWYEVPRPAPLPYTNNRFLEGGFLTDFTRARVTARLRGSVDLKGAQLLLLVHSEINGIMVNQVLHRQPFRVSKNWTEQTVTLQPDEPSWTCLGGRHDMPDRGCAPIAQVRADVNVDIIFVLFPLKIVPMCGPGRISTARGPGRTMRSIPTRAVSGTRCADDVTPFFDAAGKVSESGCDPPRRSMTA